MYEEFTSMSSLSSDRDLNPNHYTTLSPSLTLTTSNAVQILENIFNGNQQIRPTAVEIIISFTLDISLYLSYLLIGINTQKTVKYENSVTITMVAQLM